MSRSPEGGRGPFPDPRQACFVLSTQGPSGGPSPARPSEHFSGLPGQVTKELSYWERRGPCEMHFASLGGLPGGGVRAPPRGLD